MAKDIIKQLDYLRTEIDLITKDKYGFKKRIDIDKLHELLEAYEHYIRLLAKIKAGDLDE